MSEKEKAAIKKQKAIRINLIFNDKGKEFKQIVEENFKDYIKNK